MRSLSSIILCLGLAVRLLAQSPHGLELKIDCAACHKTSGWEIPADSWDFDKLMQPRVSKTTGMTLGFDTLGFNHYRTEFPLTGQHPAVDCRNCHPSLVFSEASTECISCHDDMHNQTVGTDCARCHNPENWLVNNITGLHQENGFPLLGAHAAASCLDCHISESALTFNRIGNDCINCHLDDFSATTNPNHSEAGFTTDCAECHDISRFDWATDQVNHDFFPLTKGHEITDCARCHTNGEYSTTPNDCYACHQSDYEATLLPNHQNANFSTDCITCHTTDPDWKPAQYLQHDPDYFPIYSGHHEGEWNECIDCHANPENFVEFTCTTCHTNPETDNRHNGIGGYAYNSPSCLACHPAGSADDIFDHNLTAFPLTGVHTTVECIACHANGYQGTPTDCAACHTSDFNQTTNPNHNTLGFATDCASCHTTEPDWMPASFANHNDYYALNGAHAAIANDCAACHNGDYNNTPNTCFGCHAADYTQTIDPNHTALQFSTDCASCHATEPDWMPASFANHNEYYALNGAHAAIANDCAACHNGDYNNTPNTCYGCHTEDYNQTNNPNHLSAQFPTDCEACHRENAWTPSTFDHDGQYFPIYRGKHKEGEAWNQCIECHTTPNNFSVFSCTDCHEHNNPTNLASKHRGVSGYSYASTACFSCHPRGD